MPRLATLALGLVLGACAARAPAAADGGQHVENAPGVIRRVGDLGYGIVPDADPGTRYAPDALAEEFRVDGLRVIFSGEVREPPPHARLWGTPLRLTSIRRAP
ncbi:MAG TPA: hypothetical protein VII13_17995 [Vicinamibacteria bacterium]